MHGSIMKWICSNLQRYLNPDKVFAYQYFTESSGTLYRSKPIIEFNNFSKDLDILSYDYEIKNRIKILQQTDDIVIGISPESLTELKAIDHLKSFCSYYTIFNGDRFNFCLHQLFHSYHETWFNFNNKPITLSSRVFVDLLQRYDNQARYFWSEPSKLIFIDDILTIRDDKDFCNVFYLKYKNFNFNDHFKPNLSHINPQLVSNYNELKILADRLTNK